MPVRELWHADAFAWGAGGKRARQPPTVQSFARPITPEEVDSETDDNDMEDDEERPVDGAEAGRPATQRQKEEVCHGGEGDVVVREHDVEHGPVAAAGGSHRSGGTAGGGEEASPPDKAEQRAAEDGDVLPRGAEAPGEGGGDDNEKGRAALTAEAAPVEQDEGGTTEGPASGDRREGESTEESDVVAPTGAEEGAQEDIEDEDGRRDSESVETSWGKDESEHEDAASEASCSTDCSQPRRRVHPTGRATLGKRDSGQRDPVHDCSPKRRHTGGTPETSERMYIDVDVPGGPEEDGAPHWRYVVTAPQRGTGSSCGALCTCNAPVKMQQGPQTDVSALM